MLIGVQNIDIRNYRKYKYTGANPSNSIFALGVNPVI